jgi:oxygen-independent coproporphyrinogen-3 oxidase
MYGIPEGTLASWRVTLETALSLSPEHISAYGLMLAEGTPFYEGQASLALPGEEAEAEMYLLACRMLKEAGYSHYEISNYARPGEECRHNLQYWHSGIYYGYGPSAFSFDGKARYGNGEGLSEYLENPLGREAEREILSQEDLAFEYIMLGLRMAEGISPEIYEGRFGVPFLEKYGGTVEKYLKSGHMCFENGHYRLTDAGMQISNAILVEFLGEE